MNAYATIASRTRSAARPVSSNIRPKSTKSLADAAGHDMDKNDLRKFRSISITVPVVNSASNILRQGVAQAARIRRSADRNYASRKTASRDPDNSAETANPCTDNLMVQSQRSSSLTDTENSPLIWENASQRARGTQPPSPENDSATIKSP